MAKNTLVIACDGPARAGKTTLANNFDSKLGIPCLNTGKIYRALAVLVMKKLDIDSLDKVSEKKIQETLKTINLSKLEVTFAGKVYYDGKEYDELMTPERGNAARIVSNIKAIRAKIVEPIVIKMVEDCDYAVVISEGRDEGRLWKDAGHLGLAIFLSVDPVVAAIRERHIRQALHYETPSLREITNTLMTYDLDNARRSFHPTYIAEQPVVFTGRLTTLVKRAIADKNQIIVPTSSIDIPTVFKRVLRLADTAGLLSEREKSQVSLL
ncbi:MAG TPA: (d)CMP kinase [Candidatus Saccharimonadales bacterium]|nr:(d)CMP kinase [Candidatus Saccharimonadales bacterium]